MDLAVSQGGYLVIGVLWVVGLVIALLESLVPRTRRIAWLTGLATLTTATIVAGLQWPGSGPMETGPGIGFDGFAFFVQVFVLLGYLCALLLVHRPKESSRSAGFPGLVLLSAGGASFLAIASDMTGILIGFMTALIPLWGLSAISNGPNGREGALKGMVVGALGAGLFGLGVAMFQVLAGTTILAGIAQYLGCADWIGSDPLLVTALACVLGGVGCFVASVPFHMWFVDAVEALPAPGALLLSGCVLATGLAAASRLLLVAFHPVVVSGPGYLSWTEVLHWVGLAALLVCNAMALVQQRFKRMTACLAAGQAGLVLVTLAAVGEMVADNPAEAHRAVAGILVFLAVLAVNWVGLFVAAAAIEDEDGTDPPVSRLNGLVHSHPWLAAVVGLALLCMAGMPLTAGFFCRLYLLEAMVDAGWTATAVVSALSLGLVLVMSLGLVAAMVMRTTSQPARIHRSAGLYLVAALASIAILLLGILPGGILELAIRSAGSLFTGGM
jgi:NADH-quinone oxidoreductase subunit N